MPTTGIYYYIYNMHVCLDMQGRTGREEIVINLGGYEQAPKRGEFATYLELYGGESGPRIELLHILDWLEYTVRKRQAELGVPESERTYLYDLPVGVGDNCSSNRGERGGLFAMVEIIRRHEYQYLKTIRSGMGKYVETVFVSCQHHDSALISVWFNKRKLELDMTEVDFFLGT